MLREFCWSPYGHTIHLENEKCYISNTDENPFGVRTTDHFVLETHIRKGFNNRSFIISITDDDGIVKY